MTPLEDIPWILPLKRELANLVLEPQKFGGGLRTLKVRYLITVPVSLRLTVISLLGVTKKNIYIYYVIYSYNIYVIYKYIIIIFIIDV